MKAGLLKFQIEIYESKILTSDFGENITNWSLKYKTRSNIKYESLNRSITNNEVISNTTVTFTIRDYIDVNIYDRIKYNAKFHRIISIQPNELDRCIKLITEEIND